MAMAKKQKSIRVATLNKVAGTMHMPQNTLREQYLDIVSLLVEQDPAGFSRELSFDADQLNFFLNDRARSAEIIRALVQDEKDREKEAKKEAAPPKKTKREQKAGKPQKTGELPLPEESEKPAAEPAQPVPAREEPAPVEEPETKKVPAKTQSTLFDGF
jgi:replication factor C large subunit